MKNHLFHEHQIVIKKAVNKIQATVIRQLKQLYLKAKTNSQVKDFNKQVLKS
jgi:hypothetical protein